MFLCQNLVSLFIFFSISYLTSYNPFLTQVMIIHPRFYIVENPNLYFEKIIWFANVELFENLTKKLNMT